MQALLKYAGDCFSHTIQVAQRRLLHPHVPHHDDASQSLLIHIDLPMLAIDGAVAPAMPVGAAERATRLIGALPAGFTEALMLSPPSAGFFMPSAGCAPGAARAGLAPA